MGMYNNLNDIVRVFRNDETLIRLLYYPPVDIVENTVDPLSDTTILPNILEMDDDTIWNIIDLRLKTFPKDDDLVCDPICRLYVYAGRRFPNSNYKMASQQIIVDILCHKYFEKDLRSMRLSDRINELLVEERITGMSKIDYVDGSPISAPNDYVGYRHIYQFGSTRS